MIKTPANITTQLEAFAARENITLDDLVRLLGVAYDGTRWMVAHERTLSRLEQDPGLTKHRQLAKRTRETWEKDDRRAVVVACQAMPSAAELDAAERQRHIHAPELRRWANDADTTRGGVLSGPTGAGKTMAVVSFVSRVIRAERIANRETPLLGRVVDDDGIVHPGVPSVMFVAAETIGECVEYGQVKQEPSDPYTPRGIDAWCRCGWLGIDDLGWEARPGRLAIQRVLSARYKNALPTLVTTGMPLTELQREYGVAVVRRIVECRGRKGAVVEVRE